MANTQNNEYEEWYGYHIYNEQPAPYIIRFNKDIYSFTYTII